MYSTGQVMCQIFVKKGFVKSTPRLLSMWLQSHWLTENLRGCLWIPCFSESEWFRTKFKIHVNLMCVCVFNGLELNLECMRIQGQNHIGWGWRCWALIDCIHQNCWIDFSQIWLYESATIWVCTDSDKWGWDEGLHLQSQKPCLIKKVKGKGFWHRTSIFE